MKNKGLFQPLVLGTVLAFGFLAVWGAVGIVALEIGREMAMRNLIAEALWIRADGTALIEHYEEDVSTQRDLRGVPVTIPEDDSIGRLNEVRLLPSLPWREEDKDWEQRIRCFTDGRTPYTAWYFVSDGQAGGMAYFIGYDSHRKVRIGYLGIAGFRAEMPPPEECFPFAGATLGQRGRVLCPGQDNLTHLSAGTSQTPCIVYVLGLDQKIYEADLRKRTVRIALHEQNIHSFTVYDMVKKDPINIAWRLAVRTNKDVLLMDKHGGEQRRYPIPLELREQAFTFGETSSGEAVMHDSKGYDFMDTESVDRLFWVRPEGRSRAATVTLPHDAGLRSLRYLAAAAFPSPLTLELLGVVSSRVLQEDGKASTYSAAFVQTLMVFWPALAIAQMLAAGLAVLCYRRQMRYGTCRGERIIWPLFVLMLGLPGWIGYRFGRSWPVLESCPECGVAVPRDRENCLRCTNDFPRPTLKGTEVFA